MYRLIFFALIFYMTNLSDIASQTRDIYRDNESIYCSPNDFRISKFESGEKFKIVIDKQKSENKDIKYKAKGGPGDNTWIWKIGTFDDSQPDNIKPNTQWKLLDAGNDETVFSESGWAYIPSSEYPEYNTDFGGTRGFVSVKNYISNSEGQNSTGVDAFKQVEVFYRKDAINPDSGEPNWFYYWKQNPIVTALLEIPGWTLFNNKLCQWDTDATPYTLSLKYEPTYVYTAPNPGETVTNTYGSTRFSAELMETRLLNQICPDLNLPDRVVIAYEPYYSRIKIGEGCGFSKTLKDDTHLEGIHVFYSTLIHEVQHTIIKCENWDTENLDNGVTKGYSSAWDMDKDGYKDVWENMNPIFTVVAPGEVGPNDTYGYNINGVKEQYDPDFLGQGLYSAGTEYEEKRCRDLEVASKGLHMDINVHDWSFDPTNQNQGKRW